jgi:hypothetical protein
MEVKNVYQNESGKWHIEYSLTNLMGLASRVYAGYFLLFICFGLPLLLITTLITISLAKYIHEQPNISPSLNSNLSKKSVYRDISN